MNPIQSGSGYLVRLRLEYFELVKQSSILLRRNVPEVKIIGGSLARLDLPFADTLAQLGIA